jgi:hypothetical protein
MTFGTDADSVSGVAAVSEALSRASCGVAEGTDSELNKQWTGFQVQVPPLSQSTHRNEAERTG